VGPNQFQPIDPNRDAQGFYQLQRPHSNLYKKVTYQTRETLVLDRITEYDIRSANTTMLRQAGRMKTRDLKALEELPKKEREIAIGKMIRLDKSIRQPIAKGIIRAKLDLFRSNGIQDDEVLAIKNDAVFIRGRRLRNTQFGVVEFRPKNTYALYLKLEGIEYYYDAREKRVDLKGVKDEVLEEPDHQNGMLLFLARCMDYLVMDRRDALRRYLIEFVDDYKSKRLPVRYYRELNRDNCYRTTMEISGMSFSLIVATEDDKDMINGVYNYKRFVLPIIQRFM